MIPTYQNPAMPGFLSLWLFAGAAEGYDFVLFNVKNRGLQQRQQTNSVVLTLKAATRRLPPCHRGLTSNRRKFVPRRSS